MTDSTVDEIKGKIRSGIFGEKLFLKAKREVSMTIKSGKDSIAVDLMAMAVCMFIILLKDGMPWRMSALCMGPAILIIIMHWFTIGRTVEMSEKGCTIHFYGIEKSTDGKNCR